MPKRQATRNNSPILLRLVSAVFAICPAVVASLFGIWKSIPFLFVDYLRLLRGSKLQAHEYATCASTKEFRGVLLFLTAVSVPFAFLDRPLLLIVLFTIIGSFFIPFLAGSLLFLNNRVKWISPLPHNSRSTNVALVFIFVIFAVIGLVEIGDLFK